MGGRIVWKAADALIRLAADGVCEYSPRPDRTQCARPHTGSDGRFSSVQEGVGIGRGWGDRFPGLPKLNDSPDMGFEGQFRTGPGISAVIPNSYQMSPRSVVEQGIGVI